MKIRVLVTALMCALVLAGTASAAIVNPSFESPVIAGFQYNPSDPGGWTYNFRSGLDHSSGVFYLPPPPNGTQAAFIQQFSDEGANLSSITQSLTGVNLTPSTLTFFIAQRPNFSADPIQVLYGAQNLGTFTPASTAFQTVTINFTPSASSGVLTFRSSATTAGDLDSAIDQVSFTNPSSAVPEPASALLLLPALGLFGLLRRRRQPE